MLRWRNISPLPAVGQLSRVPWNAGRAVGQKKAFSIQQARRLKKLLDAQPEPRNATLAAVAFDSCLRSCDLLSLRWDQLLDSMGKIKSRVTIRQRKTGANATFDLSPETRDRLYLLLERSCGNYVFTGKGELPLGTRQYRRLVKQWVEMLGLESECYGTHSLRRTKPAAVYEKTRDPEIARILLGQKSLQATHRYLGIGEEEALGKAKQLRF